MPSVVPDTSTTRRVAVWLPWALAGFALLAAAASWLRPGTVTSPAMPAVRFAISPPTGGAFSDTVETLCLMLSPNGSQLAYVATDARGERRVWLRPLTAVDARAVAGTEGARAVVWSPDGRSIAFFAGDKLKRIDLPDGTPVTLSDVPNVRVVGTWGAEHIIFAAIPGGIYRVPVGGGAAVLDRTADRSRNEAAVSWPWFLPDGRRFLYLARQSDGVGTLRVAEVGKPGRDVMSVVSNAQYVDPGYVIFAREGTLLGQRFDPVAAQTIGEPFAVAEPVRYFFSTGASTFAASRNGVLVYQSHLEKGRAGVARSRGQRNQCGQRLDRAWPRANFERWAQRALRPRAAEPRVLRSVPLRHRARHRAAADLGTDQRAGGRVVVGWTRHLFRRGACRISSALTLRPERTRR